MDQPVAEVRALIYFHLQTITVVMSVNGLTTVVNGSATEAGKAATVVFLYYVVIC